MSFFFKQKTAYEMRISDWSSDVCSSDLQITPGSPEAELIKPVRGGDTAKYPTIKSKPSAIDTLVEAAPELLTRAAKVLSDENLNNLTGFIADLHQISQTLATRQDSIATAPDHFGQTSAHIPTAAATARPENGSAAVGG